MIQLAMSTRGFSTDTLPKAAAMAKEAGITQLEIPIAVPLDDAEARKVRQALADEGVGVVTGAIGLDFSAEGRARLEPILEQSLSYTDAMGARLLNLYCGPCADGNVGSAQAALVDAAASVADRAARLGIVITLENELSAKPNVGESLDSWLNIARAVSPDSFRLTLDLANFVASGEESVLDRLEPAWSLIGHVHLKDLAPYSDALAQAYPDQPVFQGKHDRFLALPLGVGIVENARVMQQLVSIQYSGTITFECFGDVASLTGAAAHVRQELPGLVESG